MYVCMYICICWVRMMCIVYIINLLISIIFPFIIIIFIFRKIELNFSENNIISLFYFFFYHFQIFPFIIIIFITITHISELGTIWSSALATGLFGKRPSAAYNFHFAIVSQERREMKISFQGKFIVNYFAMSVYVPHPITIHQRITRRI